MGIILLELLKLEIIEFLLVQATVMKDPNYKLVSLPITVNKKQQYELDTFPSPYKDECIPLSLHRYSCEPAVITEKLIRSFGSVAVFLHLALNGRH